MTGNLQADGVQSRQTLFVRYCLHYSMFFGGLQGGNGELCGGLAALDFTKGEPLHRLPAVPLVLSGSLCPAGISPPRGESPLKGRLSRSGSLFYFRLPFRGAVTAGD